MGARGPAAPGLQSTFADTWKISLRREPAADIVVNPVCANLFPKCSLIFQEGAPESRINKGNTRVTQAAKSGVQVPCDLRESIRTQSTPGTRTFQERVGVLDVVNADGSG